MSTQDLQTETESRPNRTDERTRTTPTDATTVPADPRTATDRAPRTFSNRNTARLENLIDEFNAAFAESEAKSVSGS